MAVRPRVLLAFCLILLPGSLAAQTVRGLVVEQGTGAPVEGVMVWLLDARARYGGVLTGADGRFFLRAPAAGRYVVRTERIGYADVESDTLQIGAGEYVDVRLESPHRAVSLEGLVVEGEGRCETRPAEGAQVARLWTEARKALEVAAWAGRQGLFRYDLARWERTLEPGTLREKSGRRTERTVLTSSPMRSVPVAVLHRRGFIQDLLGGGWEYYAPDANVLLSDLFLDTHCFSAVQGRGAQAGLVGLAFRPVRDRRLPDVEGVLWLRRSTAELQYLEFRYTQLPHGLVSADAGGRVDLERLPSGAWIVRRWHLRMPSLAVRQGPRGRETPQIHEIKEVGGEVVAIYDDSRRSGRNVQVLIAAGQH